MKILASTFVGSAMLLATLSAEPREVNIVPILNNAGVPFAQAAKKTVSVGGAVRKPGLIELRPGITVEAAIRDAGGPTQLAQLRRVKISRNGRALFLDLTKRGRQAFKLKHGDSIEVPERRW